ncbi:hypothetical protein IWX90DRAFT_272588 [Phyllosticta citrichinensis]|uniref:RRM domain-containing protein n=1 Tax=Phyllosticta citrichinensis TaxID=1130410 RepID=A0ABR1XN32_9PEZI
MDPTDEPRVYDRERSRSPRIDRRDDDLRDRSASPGARDRMVDRGPPADHKQRGGDEDDEGAINPGSNLFVTGIHPSLSEDEITRLFEKYGDVEKCNIMRDPHSKESRGFGFVKMVTPEQADAAKEGLQGEVIEGRTLSIEKARRARPRTPTPGKYYGPPKRGMTPTSRSLPFSSNKPYMLTHTPELRGGRGGRFSDRYDDRRGGYGRRGGGDDYYSRGGARYGGGGDYYDRGYSGGSGRDYYERSNMGRRDRDYGPPRGVDRYASGGGGGGGGGRDDRYGRDDRRGGPRYHDREGAYGAPAEESYTGGGSRAYDDRGDDGYSRW